MVPFFDLSAQQAVLKHQIDGNIAKVLEHGKYILGPEVSELEERLAEYTGAKYCITCANGTDALQIALMAIGVGPGDEVITPAFSYIAVAEVITLLGAKPVLTDVEADTYNIDPSDIENKITKNTKAIVPVSLFGQPVDFDKINQLALKYNLTVIEDAAQSFGSRYKGRKSCNLADIACTSFFPTKPLGCYGDGGAIFTSNDEFATTIRQIARHGQSEKYNHVRVGVNSRLDTIQAAILLAKLRVFNQELESKASFANRYISAFENNPFINCPIIKDGTYSAWAQFTVTVENRTAFMRHAKKNGIPTMIHYPHPINHQPAFLDLEKNFATSEILSKTVLSLPMHAYTLMDEQDHIIKGLLECATISQM